MISSHNKTPDTSVTSTPSSDQAVSNTPVDPGLFSRWTAVWNFGNALVKSIPPCADFDPPVGQQPPPWVSLEFQPKDLALRLIQQTIPAKGYLHTINQCVMLYLAVKSLPACEAQPAPSAASGNASYTPAANSTNSDRAPFSTSPETTTTAPTTVPATTRLPGCRGELIPVPDRATLGKIGNQDCFPPNGNYTQTAESINAANLPPIRHFTGDYNGNGKTIRGPNNCLFEELESTGRVRNLVVTGADIRSVRRRAPRAAIACQMSGSSTLEGNRVEHSLIHVTTHDQTPLGMLTGVINGDATLRGNQVIHSRISVYRHLKNYRRDQSFESVAGMLTGIARGNSDIDSNRIEACRITATARAGLDSDPRIGLVAGIIDQWGSVKVRNSTLIDNKVTLTTRSGLGGGVAGMAHDCLIEGTQAINNRIISTAAYVNARFRSTNGAVIVAYAERCTIRDTRATDNQLTASKRIYHGSRQGIVTAECVNSKIQDTLVVNSTILTGGIRGFYSTGKSKSFDERGFSAGHAAVAAAYAKHCTIEGTTAIGVTVRNQGRFGGTGIAVAYNRDGTRVSETTAINCYIAAEGNSNGREGYGAVGVAMDYYDNLNFGVITNTSACDTTILGKFTGIAAGKSWHNDQVDGVFACNTRLTNFGQPTRIDDTGCADSDCPVAKTGTDSPPTSPITAAGSRHELTSSLFDSLSTTMPTVSSQPVSAIQPSSPPSLKTPLSSGTFGNATTRYGTSTRQPLPSTPPVGSMASASLASTSVIAPSAPSSSSQPTAVSSSSPATPHTTGIDASTRHTLSTEVSGETSYTLPATATSAITMPSITVPASAVNGTTGNVSARHNSNNEEVDVGMPMAMTWGIVAGVVAGGAAAFATYHWYQAYQQGFRGRALTLHPFHRIKETLCCHATATVNRANNLELIAFKEADTGIE